MQIELALMTGRVRQVKTWFDEIGEKDWKDDKGPHPGLRTSLGDYDYCWLGTLLAAAVGDYDKADKLLSEMAGIHLRNPGIAANVLHLVQLSLKPLSGDAKKRPPFPEWSIEQGASLLLAKAIADAPLYREKTWPNLIFQMRSLWMALGEAGRIHMYRASLALEQGRMDRLEEACKECIRLCQLFRSITTDIPTVVYEAAAELILNKRKEYTTKARSK
jgi:hypothetical protein